MPSSDWALILCCRYPYSGGVKTRLAKAVGANGAAELYAAFLRDTLAWASAPQSFDLLVSLADGCHSSRFSEDFSIHLDRIFAQNGNDLGARLSQSFEEAFRRQYERVALAVSDAPELCLEDVQAALATLDQYDVVVAPAPDGGWSLMALRRHVDVFSGVTWSTSVVLSQTLDLARASNWRVSLLRPVADIDEVEDLEAFSARLAESPELRQRLPHTARQLLVGERPHPPDRGRI
jgi:rSAM/selenodomain-associated transferase 1